MTSFLVAPLVLATFAALSVAWLKRMPTWHTCPTCHHRTESVVAPWWLKPGARWLDLRWCADCDFHGVGRRGPDWVPGHPIAHDSGFHWGAEEMGENMGFEWRRDVPEPPVAEPPDHPSGFRFRQAEESDTPPSAHRSGFRWGEGQVPVERRTSNHPSGFLWGERKTDRADGASAGRNKGGGGFAWKKPGASGERNDPRRRDGVA